MVYFRKRSTIIILKCRPPREGWRKRMTNTNERTYGELNGCFVVFIQKVWKNSLYADVSMITPEVEEVANTVFTQIRNCSYSLAAINATYEAFYSGGNIWETLVGMGETGVTNIVAEVAGWIDTLYGSGNYYACINGAAVYWRSVMDLALLGLSKVHGSKLEIKGTIDLNEYPRRLPSLAPECAGGGNYRDK